jgi:hypothetical protein
LKHFWPIPLIIGLVGCAAGWWFHASHFYCAWLGAYLFVLTVTIPAYRWSLRAAGCFALLAIPLVIGWLSQKLSVPRDPLMLLYFAVGGFLAVAGLQGKRDRVNVLTFFWIILAILIGFVDHAWPKVGGQWIVLELIVIALRLAGPAIPRKWKILFPIAHWLDMYARVSLLKHGQRIPYGNLWIDASALLLNAIGPFALAALQNLPKTAKKTRRSNTT